MQLSRFFLNALVIAALISQVFAVYRKGTRAQRVHESSFLAFKNQNRSPQDEVKKDQVSANAIHFTYASYVAA